MAIRIEKLEKRYQANGPLVLDGVDLHIQKGDFFGLLGPNGSGKTTLISILTGILSSTHGRVELLGQAVDGNHPDFKKHIGLAPQQAALYGSLTLRENLVFFAGMYGLKGDELQQKINFCTGVVQLTKSLDQSINTFSGGMRQRANIAVSILHNPEILFLDEPTVGIDPQSRNMIFDCLREFNSNGVTIVYTTHYMEEAEELCSRIAILDGGKIIAEDITAALIAKHPDCQNLGDIFLKLTGKELRD